MSQCPSFFIVGAAKAGTTSIASYLNSHPQVYFSPIKEPHFFSKDIRCENFEAGYQKLMCFDQAKYFNTLPLQDKHAAFIEKEEDYQKLFAGMRADQIGGEGSVGYLYSEVAAHEIKTKVPEAKIIIILRNPIERAFSHWLMDLRMGLVHSDAFLASLEDDINAPEHAWGKSHLYIELGLYYEQVKRYIDLFGNENVKVMLFDDLKTSTEDVMKMLTAFLNLNDFDYDLGGKKNPAKLPKFPLFHAVLRKLNLIKLGNALIPESLLTKIKERIYTTKNLPKLTSEERQEVQKYFVDDIKKLEMLINRDLSAWIK